MRTLLAKSMALAAAVFLAVPPGTCCGLAVHGKPLKAKPSCCQQAKEQPNHHVPQKPAWRCCCSQEGTRPLPVVEVDSAATVALLPLSATLEPLVPTVAALRAISSLRDPGPPLYVLQCVWLC